MPEEAHALMSRAACPAELVGRKTGTGEPKPGRLRLPRPNRHSITSMAGLRAAGLRRSWRVYLRRRRRLSDARRGPPTFKKSSIHSAGRPKICSCKEASPTLTFTAPCGGQGKRHDPAASERSGKSQRLLPNVPDASEGARGLWGDGAACEHRSEAALKRQG